MENSAVVTLRMPKALKDDSNKFFRACGLTFNQAIQLFLTQCLNRQEIPFKVIPNYDLKESVARDIEEAEKGIDCSKAYDDVNEFLRDLHA